MQSLLLLHGAIGAPAQLEPLAAQLRPFYKIYTMAFAGHGGAPVTESPFSMERFAADVLGFMDREQLEQPCVFGYSMGGYVGMCLARQNPSRISKLVTLATKYHWDPATAAKEVMMLDPAKIEQKVPAFAAALEKMHAPNDWRQLLGKTAEMMRELGDNNTLAPEHYGDIRVPAMLLLGDRDKMVTLEETLAVYRSLPNARMGMLPATPHPLEQANIDALAALVRNFIG